MGCCLHSRHCDEGWVVSLFLSNSLQFPDEETWAWFLPPNSAKNEPPKDPAVHISDQVLRIRLVERLLNYLLAIQAVNISFLSNCGMQPDSYMVFHCILPGTIALYNGSHTTFTQHFKQDLEALTFDICKLCLESCCHNHSEFCISQE